MTKEYVKYEYFKYKYLDGAEFAGEHQFPIIKSTQALPTSKIISFNQRNLVKNPEEYTLDFFIDDIRFSGLWSRLTTYYKTISKFGVVIGPDYSMYRDMPEWKRIENCGKNCTLTYYMQSLGCNIIPCALWGDLNDFAWCLDGMPIKSSIAVSPNGCYKNNSSMQIFLDGVAIIQARLRPTHLIICGKHIPELDNLYDNLFYYPTFMQRRRKEKK